MSAVKETTVVLNGGDVIKKQRFVRLISIALWVFFAKFLFPSTPEFIAENPIQYWAIIGGLGYAIYRATTGWQLFVIARRIQISEQVKSILGLDWEKPEDLATAKELIGKLEHNEKVRIPKPGSRDVEFSIDSDAKGNKILKIIS